MGNAGITAAVMVLAVFLAGCSLRGGGKNAKTAPPPPKPATTATATVPEVPLSIPQTQVQLPSPQPLNPSAVPAPAEAREPEPEPAPPPRPARRATPTVMGPAAPKSAETPAPTPVQAPAQLEERPRLEEIVPQEERRKLADQIAARKREIDEALRQASGRPLSDHDRNIVDRIKSFLQLSDQAAARGEMRQADELSDRALILARELRVAR